MTDRRQFLILDIDGVLLEANGYREACIDTVNAFIHSMGQPDLSIRRDVPDAFEASGISAEWDMVPLILAAFANWYFQLTGTLPAADVFPPRCDSVRMTDSEALRKMLLRQLDEYVSLQDPEKLMMDAIRDSYFSGSCSGLTALRESGLLPRFLCDTLDPRKNPFFSQLMNRLLGTEVFERFYGLKAPLDCESYLETKDRLIISSHYRELLPEISGKSALPVVMTYRPTVYPDADGNSESIYFVNTPEGNLAMRLLGWTDGRIPMIGAGSLCYIEEKYALHREFYVKPHPFHALASVIMAVCRDEMQSLEIARALCESDPKKDSNPAAEVLPDGEKISLAVFEDSVSGINSVRNAVTVLRSWGYDTQYRLCGIRSTNEKTGLLIQAGAELYGNVNDALDSVLDNLSI